MSEKGNVNEKVLKALQELKARADAGDVSAKFQLKRAVAQLRKQVAAVAANIARRKRETQLIGLVQSGALDHMLLGDGSEEEGVAEDDGGEEVVGWNPKSIEEGTYDELEQANDLMRSEPTADDLSHKARLKSMKHAALEQQAPFVRGNPPSVLHGTLGAAVKCWTGSGLAADQLIQQQAALWQGDDAETTGVAVTVSPVLPPNARDPAVSPITVPRLRPYAIIRYGTRGMSVAFEVDIGAGCQFMLTASNVSVQVALEETTGPSGSLDLAGMLSFSPVFRTPTPITRTRYLPHQAAPSVVVIVPVPLYAKSVWAWRDQLSLGAIPLELSFRDSQGAVKYTSTIAGGVDQADPIPLGGDIVAVGVFATGAIEINAMELIFELSL